MIANALVIQSVVMVARKVDGRAQALVGLGLATPLLPTAFFFIQML